MLAGDGGGAGGGGGAAPPAVGEGNGECGGDNDHGSGGGAFVPRSVQVGVGRVLFFFSRLPCACPVGGILISVGRPVVPT